MVRNSSWESSADCPREIVRDNSDVARTGEVWRGIALALFCALVVGSVDNVLRPRLVGQDTKMHELLIFFSTLGGLMFFGAMGFILGPILAALFVTAWEMFGTTFRSALAEPGSAAADPDYHPPV